MSYLSEQGGQRRQCSVCGEWFDVLHDCAGPFPEPERKIEVPMEWGSVKENDPLEQL